MKNLELLQQELTRSYCDKRWLRLTGASRDEVMNSVSVFAAAADGLVELADENGRIDSADILEAMILAEKEAGGIMLRARGIVGENKTSAPETAIPARDIFRLSFSLSVIPIFPPFPSPTNRQIVVTLSFPPLRSAATVSCFTASSAFPARERISVISGSLTISVNPSLQIR